VIPARTVVLDNEAVQALADAAHRKHRRVLAIVNLVATRNARRDAPAVQLVVPTAVRVEAGWHRRARKAATINRLRIDDLVLDTAAADSAVEVRSTLAVSVADAHIAACLGRTPGPHAVVTSDVEDLRRIAGHLDVDVRVLAI
jgi:hypothetical protein